MVSRWSFRNISRVAALFAAPVMGLGVSAPSLAAPPTANLTALTFPTEQERAEQIWRGQLMLGLSARAENLAGQAPYWVNGQRKMVWIVQPLRDGLENATELALAPSPGAAPMVVAFNQIAIRFEGDVDLNEAARRLRRAGLRGEIREMLAPSAYLVQVGSAIEALRVADALRSTPGVRYAHPDGVASISTTGADRGVAPEIRVEDPNGNVNTGAMVDFGSTTQGVTVNRVFTIFNDGDANLSIANPTVTGDFTLVAPVGATSIPPLQSTTFTVQMDADAPGMLTGEVTFLNNDADENPFLIDLVGEVDAPGGAQEIQITQGGLEIDNADSFDFGATAQGVPVTFVFTITNIGGQPLLINSPAITGAGFTVVTQPDSSVASGTSTEFSIRLDAAAQGVFAAAVEILNNDADENPFEILLEGEVGEPIPDGEISVFNGDDELQSGSQASFGSTEQLLPTAITFAIENTGPGDLVISGVTIPAGFSLAQSPAPTVGSGEETALTVSLDAIHSGAFSGSILIHNNDTSEDPFVILASGFVSGLPPTGGIDDIDYPSQWHHANDGTEGGAPGYDTRAPLAWDRTFGEQVIVAVMDNGSQSDHPDYNDNVAGQFLNVLTPNTSAEGDHGTSVAGLVAAEANFAGGRGSAPSAQLFLTNFFNISISEGADAFYAADAAGAAIHTNSWGFTNPNFLPEAIADAIVDLSANGRGGKGMNILFAATNDNRPVIWSSSLSTMPETIAVGSLTNAGRLAGYSDFGPWVDFVAPSSGGERRVYTTDLTGVSGYNSAQSASGGDFTSSFGGTSAATPIAAGVLALIHSVNPDLHADQVRRIMRKTSRDVLVVGADRPFERLTGFSDSFGYGLIDADAAVDAAVASLANGGFTWPEPASALTATRSGIGSTISWFNPSATDPQNEYAGALLVRYSGAQLWTPTDGLPYDGVVGGTPATGVTILAAGDVNAHVDPQATANTNVTYAVYTYNSVHNYSTPVVFRLFPREPQQIFFDDMEGDDLGWSFEDPAGGGGPLFGLPGDDDEGTNEWERGAPDIDSIDLEGNYSCNGAPCQLALFLGNPIDMFSPILGFNAAFSGTNVWATDLDGVYAPSSIHRLVSPEIDLADTENRFGSFSLSWVELMETEGSGADVARVQIVDATTGAVIRTLINNHTDMTYEWREQWFDIRNQENRKIKVVFTLESDAQGQFLGWYIDDLRVGASLGGTGPIPPAGPRRIILPGFGIIPEMSVEAGSGGDITYDGLVTMDDAVELLQQFGSTRNQSDFSFDADLDGNGRIGVGDFALMLAIIQGQPVTSDAAGNAVIAE